MRQPSSRQFWIEEKSLNLSMDYKEYIEINPKIRFGKPCIKGTRISVYDVLNWLASGMSKEEIIIDFPQLTREQILACLGYSADKERRATVVV